MSISKILAAGVAAAALMAAGGAAQADPMAYAGSNTGAFGLIDLNTAAFTSEGNSGQILAGLAVANGQIFASNYHQANGALFNVNPSSGALSALGGGEAGLDIDDFGSTPSGLYVVSEGAIQNLYSINPTTGAASLIGPTGLGYGTWRALSNNSSTLYFSDGPDLYTLSTTTGAATLVGALGSGAQMGALLLEGGVLYGGDNTNNTLDTINASTGAATVGPPDASLPGSFFGLAPYPVPTGGIPEPATWAVMLMGFGGLGAVMRRRRVSAA